MKAMILAAGEGTRLRPLTLQMPKPMVPVAGRPVLEHIMAWLKHAGIEEVGINLHYKGETITEHFGDGQAFGLQLTFSHEDRILGTSGGAKQLAHFLDETFVLVYGDVMTDLDLAEMIRAHRARPEGPHVTMGLYHVPNPSECGIVGLDGDGRVERFVEKPSEDAIFSDLANAGILIMDPEILAYAPEGEFSDFGLDIFPKLLTDDVPIYGWVLPDEAYLIDIGSQEKYAQVERDWPTPSARVFWDAWLTQGRGATSKGGA